MKIKQQAWGTTREGNTVHRFTLRNRNGMEVDVSDFGALILAIRVPCGGELRDVALGYETVGEYYDTSCGFGAFVGRNANRIADARIVLDGVAYDLDKNDGSNNLHSGYDRSHCKLYEASELENGVEFFRISPHLEQGFPGDLEQRIRYTLTDENELVIRYFMVSDRTTVINPTNHSYFNLMGHGSGSVEHHRLQISAEHFLPTDAALIPTGELRAVEGTPFDFRVPVTVGARIGDAYEALRLAGGYDHNFVLPRDGLLRRVACLESPDGKLAMTVATDLCGMQVYSGNFLAGERGKGGAVYGRRAGICFETQLYPNACNEPRFPSSIFPARQPYKSTTVYQFFASEN